MCFQGGILLCKANFPLVLAEAGCGRKVEFPTFRRAAGSGGLWVSPSPAQGTERSPKHPGLRPRPSASPREGMRGCSSRDFTAQRDPNPVLTSSTPSHHPVHHRLLIFPNLVLSTPFQKSTRTLPGASGRARSQSWGNHNPALFRDGGGSGVEGAAIPSHPEGFPVDLPSSGLPSATPAKHPPQKKNSTGR